jgi:hypothetical protein
MKRRLTARRPSDTFETVREVGLALPNVQAATKYDGSPVLKVGGAFMAGMATHRSAEAATIVVRIGLEERAWLLQEAPETYYVTDYYRHHPVVLVRLTRIDRDVLRDLLSVSWRQTVRKTRKPRLRVDRKAPKHDSVSWLRAPDRLPHSVLAPPSSKHRRA